ncbi:LysR family transcriptional regulator [Streptomyces sp. NPDC001982]|uniref:LysR family transcriptional regulator n=1 Tax=Streptomyces sp. NPDC001982 TaxID=3154405 RepID=UPI0033323EF1
MEKAENGSISSLDSENSAPQGVELRHLRYFVAVAEAGTFTHTAECVNVAQPTLSQQIRRLEVFVGTPLLQRRREGVRLTEAGAILLEESGGPQPPRGGSAARSRSRSPATPTRSTSPCWCRMRWTATR